MECYIFQLLEALQVTKRYILLLFSALTLFLLTNVACDIAFFV